MGADETRPGAGHEGRRDELDDIRTLIEAGTLCGLSPHTLAQQAEKGKLRARKVGHTWITTRQCLDAYLAHHARRKETTPHE